MAPSANSTCICHDGSGDVPVRQPAYVTGIMKKQARWREPVMYLTRESATPPAPMLLRRRDDWPLMDAAHLKRSQSPPGDVCCAPVLAAVAQ